MHFWTYLEVWITGERIPCHCKIAEIRHETKLLSFGLKLMKKNFLFMSLLWVIEPAGAARLMLDCLMRLFLL